MMHFKLLLIVSASIVILCSCSKADGNLDLLSQNTDESSMIPQNQSQFDESSKNTESQSHLESEKERIEEINPQTPIEEDQIEVLYDYPKELEKAIAIEAYLRNTLSTKDYGGIYLKQSDVVTIDLWVVNSDIVNDALQTYNGETFTINLKTARCSIENMHNFAKVLNDIELQSNEHLSVYLSEMDNLLAVNISETGANRIRAEIEKAIEEYQIANECVQIFEISEHGENPVT